jgi:tetrahydromethanopterin S-methyltransferase subunit G
MAVVGRTVGRTVGTLVGLLVGIEVDLVGHSVGKSVGISVGNAETDGTAVVICALGKAVITNNKKANIFYFFYGGFGIQ